jgi:hypothetical protein
MCKRSGPDKAWSIAFRAGFFHHMDLPLLLKISFDLNSMSDLSCRRRLRFGHRGIKELVVRTNVSDVIIVEE